MAARQKRTSDETTGERRGGARRLIAGLRISAEEESLLAVVRPYFTDLSSEGELAYRLWRRGLELALAEAVGIGARLPSGTTEQFIASLVAQRLLLCMPLLRRTGTLALVGLDTPSQTDMPMRERLAPERTVVPEAIDASAADAIAGLGGNDFL
jgi:hypothetical protein